VTAPVGGVLTPETIVVGAVAADKEEAIARVGGMLVSHGYVTPAYVDAMREREAIISTYLGNGISLPHGTSEVQDTILRTGLAVAQFPAGVPWGEERARLVIGLAARSDEHIAVMSRLASILEDAALCDRLASTTDPGEIHRALTSEPAEPRTVGTGHAPQDIGRKVRIVNPHGLHARPAAEIVERVMDLDASATIIAGDRTANAFSITQIIALGASVGDEVTVRVSGAEADRAMDAVLDILLADDDTR
jgi:multiphosphoryl transfer protein